MARAITPETILAETTTLAEAKATAARAAWLERAARVGRTVEAPTAITFAFEGGSYRAEWRKRGLQIVQIAHCARSVKWGTRPERRVV